MDPARFDEPAVLAEVAAVFEAYEHALMSNCLLYTSPSPRDS